METPKLTDFTATGSRSNTRYEVEADLNSFVCWQTFGKCGDERNSPIPRSDYSGRLLLHSPTNSRCDGCTIRAW